ncbi:MAG: helix-turn-helix transcriptional regulator [Nocardioides sp.]
MAAPVSGGARDQVARLLQLVPLLHARGGLRVDDAAAELGVPPAQVIKDLKVLFMCGLPGGMPDDLINVDLDALEGEQADGVIRVSNADYLARPLRLTPTEATALIVALRAVRASTSTDTRAVVDRTLAKLEAAAAGSPAHVDPGESSPGTSALRARLEDAVARGRQVRLTYYVPARDEESERVVDPRGVVSDQGFDYLDAWCHSAEAPRLFRLDRIHEASVLDDPVTTEQTGPRDLSDGMFTSADDATRVTLALAPEARWVTEYYPVTDVRPTADGGVEGHLLVADARWLQRLLLRLAPYASVVEPASYDAEFRHTSRAALRLYG